MSLNGKSKDFVPIRKERRKIAKKMKLRPDGVAKIVRSEGRSSHHMLRARIDFNLANNWPY